MTVSEIPRRTLVDIAEQLIATYPTLDGELVEQMRDVADTAERITWSLWNHSAKCGCLIGTARKRRGDNPMITHGDELAAGTLFVDLINQATGEEWLQWEACISVPTRKQPADDYWEVIDP